MKRNKKNGIRPNRKIWSFGNDYLEAAYLCRDNRLPLPAAINAALAIEIYLKSFLAIDFYNENGDLVAYRAENGHLFTEELIDKFEEEDRNRFFSALEKVGGKNDWYSLFQKYENTFKKTRYWYESDAAVAIDFKIIDLATTVREAVVLAASMESA